MIFLSENGWQQKTRKPEMNPKKPEISNIWTRPEPEKTRTDPKKPDPIENSSTIPKR